MKVAILGANGFIGKAVTKLFNENGADVFACGRNETKIGEIKVNSVDITKSKKLANWLKDKKIDTIIYLAALIPKTLNNADERIYEYNMMIHRQVCKYWCDKKIHLIYASTCAVYEQNNKIPWKEDNVVTPKNNYAKSKYEGELLFQSAQNSLLTTLRINAPYGIDREHKTVINIFLENALLGKNLEIYGSGNRQQDFIHITDVAKAFWVASLNQKYGVYNIASGQTITTRELANLIIKMTRTSSKIVFSGKIDPQEGKEVSINISKAKEILGFTPSLTIEQGILKCIKHYKERK